MRFIRKHHTTKVKDCEKVRSKRPATALCSTPSKENQSVKNAKP